MSILKIDGLNLFVEHSNINDVNYLIQKHIHIVRIPVRFEEKRKLCNYIDTFLKNNVIVLLAFDLPNSHYYKKSIDFMIDKYGNQIYYEIFNEPWAMNPDSNNSGYKHFESTERIFLEQTKWIDYIHNKCSNCKCLNAGIANFATNIEQDLFLKYVYRGHQDILSIHIYDCDLQKILQKLPILKLWGKSIWITEIGTLSDKSLFINTCIPSIVKYLKPKQIKYLPKKLLNRIQLMSPSDIDYRISHSAISIKCRGEAGPIDIEVSNAFDIFSGS